MTTQDDPCTAALLKRAEKAEARLASANRKIGGLLRAIRNSDDDPLKDLISELNDDVASRIIAENGCDEARARVAELEEALKRSCEFAGDLQVTRAKLWDELQAENARLRTALVKYGCHSDDCVDAYAAAVCDGGLKQCICGYTGALAPQEPQA